MAKAAGLRVPPKKSAQLGDLQVTNKTMGTILVRRTSRGLEVTNCCLEEQGL